MYSTIRHPRVLDEYPYKGVFYIPVDFQGEEGELIDFDIPDDAETETIILETPCDIQETTKGWSAGAITASFNVYFPFKGEDMPVRRGMMFRSEAYTMPVNGIVAGVIPTQLEGCTAYIKDVNS